jgi:hypothetical protein
MPVVVVSGSIANKHLNGGETWIFLSWVRGLARLGCEVYFVEQIEPEACVGDGGDRVAFAESVNKQYFDRVMDEFGLIDSAALIFGAGEDTSGISYPEALEIAGRADLLANHSGHLGLPELRRRFRRAAYIDQDPGFTQFWQAEGNLGARLDAHDIYFTVGENIGTPGCAIPTVGIDWRPLRQPVVLEDWPVTTSPARGFSTVGAWRGAFGPVVDGDRTYGVKVHEFRKVLELPRRVPGATFEIALDIHPADAKDRAALLAGGWRLTDPRVEVPGPIEFRRYVQTAGAEFSVAQGIYVETGSGWFSDRTTRYLASGKPAVVQETGFSCNLPAGEGVLSFRTVEEAASAAEAITSDYERQAAAARRLAEEHFDSDNILSKFLEEALA